LKFSKSETFFRFFERIPLFVPPHLIEVSKF
jgi:hypothetical protein